MMDLPDYWLPRPAIRSPEEAVPAFRTLLAEAVSAGPNTLIEYRLPFPKWQFLCALADDHGLAMHGTGDPDIRVLEPRQAVDLGAFGNQAAVYAAGDGLWAMFFAIVDRDRHRMSLTNACIRLTDASGTISEPRYVFSISRAALRERPWRTGFVYLLPPDTFEAQPPLRFGRYTVHIPQLASAAPVRPLARLSVEPHEFPFLDQVRGHDDARLAEYGQAMQTGGPWPLP